MQPAVPDPPAAQADLAPGEAAEGSFRREAREGALVLFRHMVRLRLVSHRMVELQREGKIAFHASCIGEESAIVAAALAARADDWVFPGTREWGVALVRGLPLATYVSHAFGNAEDPAKGHAPPDHPPAKSVKVAPASGVVGAHVPQAVGLAWAAKIRKDDVVAIAVFGDGATSTGDFHNAMNFAGVVRSASVFVCRNNGRAGASPTSRQTRTETLAEKAVAYGVASARVSGADPLEAFALVREGVARAAAGKGALFVEMLTHPPETLDGKDLFALSEHDPLVALRRVLERDGKLDATAEERMRAEIRAEIDEAVARAERVPPPAASTIFEDVYATMPPHLEAQSAWGRSNALVRNPRNKE